MPNRKSQIIARRTLLLAVMVLGIGLLPGGARALDHSQPVNIGVLTIAWGTVPAAETLRKGLAELGYRENVDFAIGIRFTQGRSQELHQGALDLVQAGSDIIFATGGVPALAAQRATTRIRIVFSVETDPVAMGLVRSFSRPGGNVTGVTDRTIELSGKRLQLFRGMVPRLRKVLFLYEAGNATYQAQARAYSDAARRLGLELIERIARTEEEVRQALRGLKKQEIDGSVSPWNIELNIPGDILEASTQQKIPAIFSFLNFVEIGGLASYGPSLRTAGRLAARMMEKIFRGTSPGGIPVEVNTDIEFAVNLKTAKALGLTIAPELLYQATHIVR
ncbi:MAG: ABC transporter substrate-binding protein [SAR324 cluster bacterium]|nr:ABC transporter substrate-binding protein [SAR324 cluster bacterium]